MGIQFWRVTVRDGRAKAWSQEQEAEGKLKIACGFLNIKTDFL